MITAAVLTLSDKGAKGQREDESGRVIRDFLKGMGWEVRHYEVLPDEKELIREALIKYSGTVSLILTTGGTGLGPRDVTPEATAGVIEKEIPGIPEAMRAYGIGKTKRAMLTRAVAGVRAGTLIINLPGSPKAVKESLEAIAEVIPHAVEKIKGSARECAG
ncbi:MAG: MogA/MoaB family molybdenum cofactor biosynthesis protein [Thermodesulfovibrionales bacterium]|nr:MogA/MoaB family molybdenum cofactor biosynthesis protein [Thermodesulfovibrionales bacterium]